MKPAVTPVIVPPSPSIAPSHKKMASIEPARAPIVRKIAISLRRSITIITSVATILKAATSTINNSTRKYVDFSSLSAENSGASVSVQSLTRYRPPATAAILRAIAGASNRLCTRTSRPVSSWGSSAKRVVLFFNATNIKDESYSYIPEWNRPPTTNRRSRGEPMPEATLVGEMTTRGSPTPMPNSSASDLPTIIPGKRTVRFLPFSVRLVGSIWSNFSREPLSRVFFNSLNTGLLAGNTWIRPGSAERNLGVESQQPSSQIFLEAAHDRQHDRECEGADCDAGHRNQCDQ